MGTKFTAGLMWVWDTGEPDQGPGKGRPRPEPPQPREFRGPSKWKNTERLAVWSAWSCGSAAMCRIGKTRARCARRRRG